MDERGYSKIEGRLKDMIIRGGENIYPRELEELLFRHPTVGDVAIVGLPDDYLGETVAAFLRAAPGQTERRCSDTYESTSLRRKPQPTGMNWINFRLPDLGRFRSLS